MAAKKLLRNRPIETKSPVLRAMFEIIAQQGLSMEAVGLAMGTTTQQLWQWRAGKIMPRLDKVEKLAQAIGADLDVFYPPDQK